jgi:hypothetical protein
LWRSSDTAMFFDNSRHGHFAHISGLGPQRPCHPNLPRLNLSFTLRGVFPALKIAPLQVKMGD